MMNSVSFSGKHLSMMSPRDFKVSDGDSKDEAQSPATALPLKHHQPISEDTFQKKEPGLPIFLITGEDDDFTPQAFVPSAEDDDEVERLNQGRNWTDIEDVAVRKENYRQVMNELMQKKGNKLPVGEQDKGDEENMETIDAALVNRAHKRKGPIDVEPDAPRNKKVYLLLKA